METPQVTVWRVAAVQKVRANNPHAAIDSLVARFRQLRPDLVRFTYLSKTSQPFPIPQKLIDFASNVPNRTVLLGSPTHRPSSKKC